MYKSMAFHVNKFGKILAKLAWLFQKILQKILFHHLKHITCMVIFIVS